MKIILGSSSPNRKELFDRMGIDYAVVSPTSDEIVNPDESSIENIERFALEKAQSIFPDKTKPPYEGNFLVMGFDSMIEFDGAVLGKAGTKKSAFEMIQSFVGKEQKVTTGMACVGVWKGEYFEKVVHESTPVKFRSDTTNCQIRSYLEFGDYAGKCGAYSILGPGIFLLEKIDGDFQNIIGVPVIKFGEVIREITGKSPLSLLSPRD